LEWAYFIGALEFFGGIMLAIGLLTRVVAAAFVIEMAVISFGVLWPVWSWGKHGMEYALLMGILALAILFRDGGRYALDHYLGRELSWIDSMKPTSVGWAKLPGTGTMIARTCAILPTRPHLAAVAWAKLRGAAQS
jgi:hypothetical protein